MGQRFLCVDRTLNIPKFWWLHINLSEFGGGRLLHGSKQKSLDTKTNPHQDTILKDERSLKLHHSSTECSLACYVENSQSLDHIHKGGTGGLRYIQGTFAADPRLLIPMQHNIRADQS